VHTIFQLRKRYDSNVTGYLMQMLCFFVDEIDFPFYRERSRGEKEGVPVHELSESRLDKCLTAMSPIQNISFLNEI
jgi:hypothetical protein